VDAIVSNLSPALVPWLESLSLDSVVEVAGNDEAGQ
jgi:hypothetical protein